MHGAIGVECDHLNVIHPGHQAHLDRLTGVARSRDDFDPAPLDIRYSSAVNEGTNIADTAPAVDNPDMQID